MGIFCGNHVLAKKLSQVSASMGLDLNKDIYLVSCCVGREDLKENSRMNLIDINIDGMIEKSMESLQNHLIHGSTLKSSIETKITLSTYDKTSSDTSSSAMITQAKNQLNSNFFLKLEDLAEQLGVTRQWLDKCFKKEVGVTLHQWRFASKLEHSKWLLIHTEDSIESIAYQINLSSHSYFIRCFQKKYHESPGRFRRRFGSIS